MVRTSQQPPVPAQFAEVIRRLGQAPAAAMIARWREVAVTQPPELPQARARWMANLSTSTRRDFQRVLEENVIWKTMASWRTSASQYASAVQLWGCAAAVVDHAPWPPTRSVLDAFAFFFKHGPTLTRYVSHIRSALRLVESPLGALADTSALTRGAAKWSTSSVRYKARAGANETRALARFARKDVGRTDIADSRGLHGISASGMELRWCRYSLQARTRQSVSTLLATCLLCR